MCDQVSWDAVTLIIPPAQAVILCYDKPGDNPSDDGAGSATPHHPSGVFALSMTFGIVLEVLLLPHYFVDIHSRAFKASFT